MGCRWVCRCLALACLGACSKACLRLFVCFADAPGEDLGQQAESAHAVRRCFTNDMDAKHPVEYVQIPLERLANLQ